MVARCNDLPEEIDALRAALLTERARAARVEAELAVARAKASDDELPPNWWTPLLSSDGSGKVSNGSGTASFYG